MGNTKQTTRSPLARLLDSYIVDVLGHLAPAEEARVVQVVRVLFPEARDWRACMREQFGLTPGLSDELAALWRQGQAIAAEQGAELTPRAFAKMVVDENFADALEMLNTELAARTALASDDAD